MKALLMVFLGGGLGSVSRYLISKILNIAGYPFPLGTFSVNIAGSLLLGFVLGLALKTDHFSNSTILFLATGFCGGFTTFSTFAFENQGLLKSGDYFNFTLYTLGSIIVGFAAIFAGLYLSKLV
mgnify:CR=1 FL=1